MSEKPTYEELEQEVRVSKKKMLVHERHLFRFFNQISELFLASDTVDATQVELPKKIAAFFRAPIVAIEFFDAKMGEMIFAGIVGITVSGDRPLRVPVDQTISGKVVGERRAFVGLDVRDHADYRARSLRDLNVVTFACFPMSTRDGVIGTLAVADRIARQDIVDSAEMIQALANILAQEFSRIEAVQALRESEKRFRLAFDNANVGVCLVDTNGKMLKVNRRMCDIFGYSQSELESMTVNDITYPEDKDISTKFIRSSVDGEVETSVFEKRYFHKNEGIVFGQVSSSIVKNEEGEPLYFISHVQDITERKLAEETLKKSEERFSKLFFSSPTWLGFTRLEDGKFMEVNKSFERVSGFTREEVIGRTPIEIGLWDDSEKREELMKLAREKGGFQEQEVVFRNKRGNPLRVLWSAEVLELHGEACLLSTVMDISALKRSEEEKNRLQEALQQSQKMEAVGTLAGGIAHDFNNILAIILGNAELATDDVPDFNPAKENLEEIRLASIRAKEVVQQLLSFSRKTDQEIAPLNLVPVIRESMKMLRTAIPTSIEFKTHIIDDSCHVLGDATQINQIIMNLATNAAHAMFEKGGLLEMTLENAIFLEETQCFDWVLSPGAYVRLKMRDTGTGIDPKIINKIFEPYFTTKEVGKGTGMGLSVLHGILRRHNGAIRVESELGKGTLFEVYFPLLKGKVEKEKISKGKIKKGSEKILFVDDEASIVKLNHQRLERLGYQVQSTQKPEKALEWFRADPNAFDVIITDLTMPRMSGDRLTKEILAISPKIPVIICTGYSERMSETAAMALGACKYIEKPIENQNLAAALREVLEGK